MAIKEIHWAADHSSFESMGSWQGAKSGLSGKQNTSALS